jgi:hypothetical protein
VSARAARRLAWSSWVVAVVLTGGTAVFLLLAGDVKGQNAAFDAVLAVVLLTYPTVGAVIAVRRPGNAIGWLFCAVGVPFSLTTFCYAYATYVLRTAPGSLPGGEIAAWLSAWVQFPPLFGAPALLFLLFPHGRLLGPRWRGAVWLTGIAMVGFAAAPALRPGPMPDAAVKETVNPVGIAGAGSVLDIVGRVAGACALLALLLATASLALRLRRSRGTERLQIKWVAFAAALFALACVLGFTVFGQNDILFGLVVVGAFAAIPLAAGVAILRYRLYDIDLVIRRTLVYGGLTATLAATYLALVLLVGLAVGRSGFAVAVSTLAVAALFRPARARIQATVDRRFYRRRYDAARTLEAFGARLRDELDLETLGSDLSGVVRETVQPAHVSLWLRSES